MTILSDGTIKECLSSGTIDVYPRPAESQIQPASLDVTLDNKLYDCAADTMLEQDQFTLEPYKRYLGQTKERISLPNDIAAQLAGRSTVGRMGIIVHKTAGWIDPEFTGTITLELMNLRDDPVMLSHGDRIAQLVFLWLDRQSSGYDGQYQAQSDPTPANEL